MYSLEIKVNSRYNQAGYNEVFVCNEVVFDPLARISMESTSVITKSQPFGEFPLMKSAESIVDDSLLVYVEHSESMLQEMLDRSSM